MKQHRHDARHPILQTLSVIRGDSTINESDPHNQHTVQQVSTVVNDITAFQDIEESVQYLHLMYKERIVVVTPRVLGQELMH